MLALGYRKIKVESNNSCIKVSLLVKYEVVRNAIKQRLDEQDQRHSHVCSLVQLVYEEHLCERGGGYTDHAAEGGFVDVGLELIWVLGLEVVGQVELLDGRVEQTAYEGNDYNDRLVVGEYQFEAPAHLPDGLEEGGLCSL